jgi:predicted ATPase
LIRAQSIQRINGQLLSSYRFQHIIFQKFLYSSLDEVERVHLHERVGTALEALYGAHGEIAPISPQLARHFQEASITEKAVHYLQLAGERAVQMSAYQEATVHLTRGQALLMTLPDSLERAEQELTLQIALGMAWIGPKGYGSEVKKAYTRARELCQQLGKTYQLSRVLGEMSVFHYVRAEHQQARELAEEALDLAQRSEDPMLVALSRWCLGFILFALGEYTTALDHNEQVVAFYNPETHHRSLVVLRGSDIGPSALAYTACCLWCLGYPDQAQKRRQQALTLARELGHPFTLCDVVAFAGCLLDVMRRDAGALKEDADELVQLSSEKGLSGWMWTASCHLGEALVMLGQFKEGISQLRQGMAASEALGEWCYLTGILRSMAEAQAKAGHPEHALNTLDEAFTRLEGTDERHWEAELNRLRGELLHMQDDQAGAEASFDRAIQVARRQLARSWELRATTSLARLWQEQGRTDEARQVLGEIYAWFTEGFDTPDLKEANALLEELA